MLVRFAAALAALAFVAVLPAVTAACDSDNDCSPPTPICNVECVECILDIDCGDTAPVCNGATGDCGACSSDASCSRFPATPACRAGGGCGECSATNHALCTGTEPACNLSSGTCEACDDDGDCTGNPDGGTCLSSGACGELTAGCTETPRVCTEAGSSLIRFNRESDPAKNLLIWKWSAGHIEPEELGDPVFTNEMAICFYRGAALVESALLEPTASFWKETPAGFKFVHPVGNADGLRKVALRWGIGDARITVKGRGANLATPALPIGSEPLVVQLVGTTGGGSPCWASPFEPPHRSDDGRNFKTVARP
jgi:hypothetical protein